jgi:hypothetical protein
MISAADKQEARSLPMMEEKRRKAFLVSLCLVCPLFSNPDLDLSTATEVRASVEGQRMRRFDNV